MSSMSSMSSVLARSSSSGVSFNRSGRAGRRHPCRGVSKQATAAGRCRHPSVSFVRLVVCVSSHPRSSVSCVVMYGGALLVVARAVM